MKALVTGSNGFIGKHLVAALRADAKFTDVFATTRCGENDETRLDVGNLYEVKREMARLQPDIIFHLAGDPMVKLDETDKNGFYQWKTNVNGTHNLLSCAKPWARFVLASSATVYGDQSPSNGLTEKLSASPSSIYGASKAAAESLVEAYTRLGRVRGLSLRYVATVGSGATHGVLPDLMNKLFSRASPYLDIIGNAPGSCKPYMHISDTVAATIVLGTSDLVSTFNIAPNDSISVESLAMHMMAAVGIHKPIRWMGWDANWEGDNRHVRVSDRLLQAFGFRLRYPTSADAVTKASKEQMQ